MRICPNKRSKLWKDFVKRVGSETTAYNIFFLRDGDIEDITDEEIASYTGNKSYQETVSNEILSNFPNTFQIGSSVLNLNREPQDIDFISFDSDEQILNWLDTNNIPYNVSDIDVNFNYKGQNISIALDQQTKNFLDSIGVEDINQYLEPNRKLVNLTLDYKKALGRDKDLQDLEEHYSYNQPSTISYKPIKPGVTELFESNPELANIGTAEQYSQYLDTIFPDSKVKDIVYHGTDFKFEKFDKSFYQSGADYIYFGKLNTPGFKSLSRTIPAIINLENPSTFIDNKTNKVTNEDGFIEDYSSKFMETASEEGEFLNQYGVKEPEQIHILGSKQDIEGFKEFVNTPQNLPSFKPVALLTLSPLKQIDFRESLKVGNKLTFNYWDEGDQIEKSETDFVVEQIGKNNFTGTSVNGTNTISYSDVIDTSIDRTLSPNDRRIFFENLAVGKFVKLNTIYGPIEGIVSSFDNERFTVGENIIKYSEIYKSNEIIDFELRLQELRRTLNNQLLVTKNIKTAEQKRRVDNLREALDNLNKYGGNLEDLHALFVTMRDNFKRVKATINNISKNSTEMTPEKILYTISYAKNYIDSFAGLRSINTSIQNFEGSKELKAASASLVAELTNVQDEYFEIAIPKLAEVLWKQFNPKINKELEKIKQDPWTLERLIQELRNPTRDIDALNTYFVAPINSNDIIVSLFTKVLKFAREKARALDEKLLRNITPLIDKVKAKMDINEAMKSFYTEVDMQVVENGEEKTIRVRKFIDKYNTETWYNTTNLIYQERQMLYDQLSIAKTENNIPEIQKLSALIRGLNRRLQMFRESNGIQITGEKFKVEMERYKEFDEPKFWKFLDSYYKRVELDQTNNTTISVKNEETGEIDYYNYSGNRWVPNLELFLTKEYQDLERGDKDVFELYKFVKDEYDKANYKIPMSYRLHNVVPSMYEKNFLDSIQKSAQNFFEDNNKQYLVRMDGRAYKEIPIGFTKILDVSKSDSNILRSTLMFITEANNYATMNEQYGSVDAITQILANNNPLDETQKKRIQSEINNRKEAINKIIKQTYYGERNTTHGMAGKTIDALSKFTSLTRLALKPLNWVSNFLRGNFENMSEAIGGRHYSISDLKWANKEFIKLQAKNPQKIANMIRSLDAIQGRFMKSFGDEFMSFKEKYGNMDVLFLGQDLGEVQIQGTAMLALLKAWNIQIPEDGNFDMDNLPPYFVDTLHAINKHNHGVYNDFDRLYAQDNALFRLFLQFRKYIVPTFRSRYSGIFSGEYRVDYEAGTVERGYYREFGEYIYNSFKNFESLPNMIASFKTLNPVQQEGVKRTMVDLVGFFGFIVMSSLFKPGDDEEEDDSIVSDIRWHIAYQFARLKGDLGTYIPIFGTKDQLRIINNPFAAVPVISDIFNLFAALGDISPDKNGNWWLAKEYLRNTATRQKGELKIFGVLSKLNPLDNVLETFFPEEMYDKFDKASQR